jgi:hypothetical protein
LSSSSTQPMISPDREHAKADTTLSDDEDDTEICVDNKHCEYSIRILKFYLKNDCRFLNMWKNNKQQNCIFLWSRYYSINKYVDFLYSACARRVSLNDVFILTDFFSILLAFFI